jgi:peptidoglycan/LPS O-acetylase OafA/YrhL
MSKAQMSATTILIDSQREGAVRVVRPYWPQLDGIRAIAVTAVVLMHDSYGLTPGGFIGVDLFFVLSGFLITHLLLTEIREISGGVQFGRFYMRRILRLYPALIVLVLLMWPAYSLDPSVFGVPAHAMPYWSMALAALFYYSNFYNGYAYNVLAHTWSLSIEEQFYLVWPVVLTLISRYAGKRTGLAIVFALICAAMGLRLFVWHLGYVNPLGPTYVWPFCRMDSLLAGAMIAMIYPGDQFQRTSGVRFHTGAIFAVGLAIFSVLVLKLDIQVSARSMISWGYPGVAFICAVLIVAALYSRPRDWHYRFLTLPFMRFVGKRSYGIYIYHLLVFRLLEPLRLKHSTYNFAAVFVLRILITLLVAGLSYRYVEQPVIRLKKRFEPSLGTS